MSGIPDANTFTRPTSKNALRRRSGARAYILLEVLVAMTVFAIGGGVLIRSLMNAYNATATLRDMTKALYLTQNMLHELEIRYNRQADVQLGEFEGFYPYPGTYKFRWRARIEYDKKMDAYVITVRTTWDDEDRSARRRRGRRSRDESSGVTLKTMVLTARYNEDLALGFGNGGSPQIQKRGGSRYQKGERGRR